MSIDTEQIHEQVRRRFAMVATEPGAERRFEIGQASALNLGYDRNTLDSLPAPAMESFAGVGKGQCFGRRSRWFRNSQAALGASRDFRLPTLTPSARWERYRLLAK
ncbi:MAG: hypothetical protein ACYSVY_12250 [Planctomycetota bacterium]|jgi:hypothetical protein